MIVLEGIDGSGTTTQTKLLAETLRARGQSVHVTREPSTGPVGQLIRQCLTGHYDPCSEDMMALLFAADRADHIAREVEPAERAGKLVISDRYYHSSFAYQGRGERRQWVMELNIRAPAPELTLFLCVDPEVAAQRRAKRGGAEEIYDAIETQRSVAAAYDEVMEYLAAGDNPIVWINANLNTEDVAADVLRAVEEAGLA